MVTIFCSGATALTGVAQARVATPSIWTVQEPHCAIPQPYLVPVNPACSRSTQSKGVSGSTSISRIVPLIVSRAIRGLLMMGAKPELSAGALQRAPEAKDDLSRNLA